MPLKQSLCSTSHLHRCCRQRSSCICRDWLPSLASRILKSSGRMTGNERTQPGSCVLTQNSTGNQIRLPEAEMPPNPHFPLQLCCQAARSTTWPTQPILVDQAWLPNLATFREHCNPLYFCQSFSLWNKQKPAVISRKCLFASSAHILFLVSTLKNYIGSYCMWDLR